jgi:hypothetical protein
MFGCRPTMKNWLLFFFLLVALISILNVVLMRTLLLPIVGLSEGGHLLGDPLYYHNIALRHADLMRTHGLGIWEIHLDGQGPAGVASLIYYFGGGISGVILANSLLHSWSCLVLLMIALKFFDKGVAILCVVPVVASPFQMVWFSQINKESFIIAGFLTCTYALLKAFETKRWMSSDSLVVSALLVSGFLLNYIGRPYVNQLIAFYFVFATIAVILRRMSVVRQSFLIPLRSIFPLLLFMAIIFSLSPLSNGGASGDTISGIQSAAPGNILSNDVIKASEITRSCLNESFTNWKYSSRMTQSFETKIVALMSQRCLFFLQLDDKNPVTQCAVLDEHIFPSSIIDVAQYVPYAVINGFLGSIRTAFECGEIGLGSTFVIYTTAESLIFLCLMPGLAFLLFRNARVSEKMIPVLFCAACIIVTYGLAVPFTGALYRYRFPFLMLIFCLALGANICFVKRALNWWYK